jgi:hypothetical protein
LQSPLWCLSQALLLISPYCSYDSYCSSCSLLILNSAWSLDVVKLVQANVSWGRCCTLGPPCLPPRHPFGALKHPSHGIWMHLNAFECIWCIGPKSWMLQIASNLFQIV